MENKVQLIEAIVRSLSSENPSTLIQKIQPGEGSWQNELLLFVKPEIFMVDQKELIQESLRLVFEKLAAFDVHVDGIITLTGSLLDEKGIMNRHYGFINRLSRSASQILTGEDRKKIAAALNMPSLDGYELLGGHEYLVKFPNDS
ncbi:MAG: hypothetical protein HGA53_11410, partial [Anaerolineaceae bacterium]|nr:hypothetical protein [Anaerolineaceae bacterium]